VTVSALAGLPRFDAVPLVRLWPELDPPDDQSDQQHYENNLHPEISQNVHLIPPENA